MGEGMAFMELFFKGGWLGLCAALALASFSRKGRMGLCGDDIRRFRLYTAWGCGGGKAQVVRVRGRHRAVLREIVR